MSAAATTVSLDDELDDEPVHIAACAAISKDLDARAVSGTIEGNPLGD